jgi:hypothetical protein
MHATTAGRSTAIAAALLVVLLVALVTTTVLGYFIYERTLSGLLTSRFAFIAQEIKGKVEAGIDLGLPLGQLENVDDLLRLEMGNDASLVAISIVNTGGSVLFDTRGERLHAPAPAPSAWALDLARKPLIPEKVYQHGAEIALPLFTSFGKMVGVLVVSYSGAFYDDKRISVAHDLISVTALVMAIAGFIAVAGVRLITRPMDKAVARLGAGLDALRHRLGLSRPDEPAPVAEAAHDSDIERALIGAIVTLERAERRLGLQPRDHAAKDGAAGGPPAGRAGAGR